MRCDEVTLTYADLMTHSRRLARELSAIGAPAESIIALMLHRTEDIAVAQLGVMMACCAFLPLDVKWPGARLAAILEDSGCSYVVLHESHRNLIPTTFVGSVIAVRNDTRLSSFTAGAQVSDFSSARPDLAAYVIYTSGTTGKPKGVVVEHCQVYNSLKAWQAILGRHACVKYAFTANYVFDATLYQLYTPLISGGCAVVCQDIFCMPEDVVVFDTVASVLALLPHVPAAAEVVVQGGEAMTLAACMNLASLKDIPTLNGYGPTEAAVAVAHKWVDTDALNITGAPHTNCQLHIVDPIVMQLQPLGVPGELCIGGLQVARGYLNRPDLTSQKFIACPWDQAVGRLYRTGDLMRWLPSGELEFHGRIDSQVKIRGFRIELGEIEARDLVAQLYFCPNE